MSRKLVKVSEEQLKKEQQAIRKEKASALIKHIVAVLIMFVIPVASYFMMEFLIRNPFEKMKWNIQVLNMAFWEILMLILFCAYGSLRAAVRTEVIVAYLVGLFDYFVIGFRSAPVQPWDIYSIKVALSVADNYEFKIKAKVIIIGLIAIAICVGVHWFNYKIDRKNKIKLIASLAGLVVALIFMGNYVSYVQKDTTVKKYGIYDKLFTPTTMTYKDGTIVAFLMECQYLKVDKPQGYSDKKAIELLSTEADGNGFGVSKVLWSDEDGEFKLNGEVVNQKKKKNKKIGLTDVVTDARVSENSPNIIVIMDEAFSDIRVLNQEYDTNVDEMPFVRSMMAGADNTVSGYLNVSVLGGNTANTEFEFLTGNSMAWLPNGCVPYQQFVKGDKESIASVLKNQGYDTLAIHPYKAKGWDRPLVYDCFGFDEFISEREFRDAEIIRKYVSDRAGFEKIAESLNEKEKGKPLFVFNVTMQNHGSYTDYFENFEPDVKVDGVDKFVTNQYLSLIKRTDESLNEFIDYLSYYDEPTLVVFFGDHQPADSVVNPIYKHNGTSVGSLSEEELRNRYKVPFFMWANYDIEEATDIEISPNILGVKMMETAGVKLSEYEEYILGISRKYTSISTLGVTDIQGNTYELSEMDKELADYRKLQYYMLFR
ncbi:MAG: LTA synthase family protein [Lachnospiraceae bacterium]|nr:LTA synthase family protein [Candidatus Colinaster scatohippi]